MKTLADLDRTHRNIPSQVIRQMTGDRTGQFPHDYLWRDMRRSAGIALRQRKLTQLEAMRLIAVTVTWQETGYLPKSLVQVNRVASELLNTTVVENAFAALQERTLSAAELREAIAQTTGKHPSKSTLYSWGQQLGTRYSKKAQYSPAQVNRFIILARSSCIQDS